MKIFRRKRAICKTCIEQSSCSLISIRKKLCVNYPLISPRTKTIIREAQLLESIIYIAIPLGFCRNIGYNFRHLSSFAMECGRMHAMNRSSLPSAIIDY